MTAKHKFPHDAAFQLLVRCFFLHVSLYEIKMSIRPWQEVKATIGKPLFLKAQTCISLFSV